MVDHNGIRQLLPDVNLDEGKKTRMQRIEAAMESGWTQPLNPTNGDSNQSFRLVLIKSHPVQCSFTLLNAKTNQRSEIDSSAKLLATWP